MIWDAREVMHTCNLSPDRQKPEGQEFRIVLGYILTPRPAREHSIPISKVKK